MNKRILRRAGRSGHASDFERRVRRALELLHQDPTLTDSQLTTWLAREAGCTREDVTCAVCGAFSEWERLGASRATKARARRVA
jgi:hypothetical protein